MRLTNVIRDAFIRAVMDDAPSVDYSERIRDAVTAKAVRKLPPQIRALWDDTKLRPFLKTQYVHVYYEGVVVPACEHQCNDEYENDKAIAALVDAAKAARKTRGDLELCLRAAAYSCTTRKALADTLPEFEKYLPADETKALRSLPVVASVVPAFVKAGWPKDKQPEKVAA